MWPIKEYCKRLWLHHSLSSAFINTKNRDIMQEKDFALMSDNELVEGLMAVPKNDKLQ